MFLLDASTHDHIRRPTTKEVNDMFRKHDDRRARAERQRRRREIERQSQRQRASSDPDWWEFIRRMR